MEYQITNHNQVISDYLMNREIAATSKKTYSCILKNFFSWMVKNGLDAGKPSTPNAIAYKASLELSGKSHYTVLLYMMALRTFFSWMVQAGYYDRVITQGMKRMKKSTAYTKLSINQEQVHTLIQSINTESIIGKRDKLIISLAVTTGLRVVELSRISIGDINGNRISVQRKGYTTKGQSISMPDTIIDLISDYTTARIEQGEDISNESAL